MNPIKTAIVRHLIGYAGGLLGGWVIAKGYITPEVWAAVQENLSTLILSTLGGGGALYWSLADKKALTAKTEVRGFDLAANPIVENPVVQEGAVIHKGFFLGSRSRENLKGVHPDLVRVIEAAIVGAPYDFTVVEGVRTEDKQRANVASGASLTMKSKHLKQKDGFSHAVDLYVFDPSQKNGIDSRPATYTELDKHIQKVADYLNVPIRWGGTFKRANGKPWFDGHHWQIET